MANLPFSLFPILLLSFPVFFFRLCRSHFCSEIGCCLPVCVQLIIRGRGGGRGNWQDKKQLGSHKIKPAENTQIWPNFEIVVLSSWIWDMFTSAKTTWKVEENRNSPASCIAHPHFSRDYNTHTHSKLRECGAVGLKRERSHSSCACVCVSGFWSQKMRKEEGER